MHGGAIPAVRKSARERLLAMVDPALDALLRALKTGPPCEHCGRSDADRDPVVLRAAQLVLDRAGYHPTLAVEQVAPNPYADLSASALADRAEFIAVECRRIADDEARRLLPVATEGFLVPEGDDEPDVGHTVQPDSTQPLDPERVPAPLPVGNNAYTNGPSTADAAIQNPNVEIHDGNINTPEGTCDVEDDAQ
jgi:hypothetical protein